MTRTTRTIVPIIVSVTSCSASRTETARSLTADRRTDCGSCDWNSASFARTESTTLTVLASGWRRMPSEIDVSPLNDAAVLTVS